MRRNVDLHLAIDNLTDRVYYETQNYLESRVPGQPALLGINATPGFRVGSPSGSHFALRKNNPVSQNNICCHEIHLATLLRKEI